MDLLVREACPNDAEQVVAILNPIIEAGSHTVFDTPFTVEEERGYIESLPDRGIFLVAEQVASRRIVGFQSLEPFANYTNAFDHVGVLGTYVSPDHRRQGIAEGCFKPLTRPPAVRATRRFSRLSGRTTRPHWQPTRAKDFRLPVVPGNTPSWRENTLTKF